MYPTLYCVGLFFFKATKQFIKCLVASSQGGGNTKLHRGYRGFLHLAMPPKKNNYFFKFRKREEGRRMALTADEIQYLIDKAAREKYMAYIKKKKGYTPGART